MKNNRVREPRQAALVGVAALGVVGATAVAFSLAHRAAAHQSPSPTPAAYDTTPLVTGKAITPQGTQAQVGSIPVNLALSPDGKYLLTSSMGDRSYVCALRASDGQVASKINFDDGAAGRQRASVYYGLAFGPKAADGTTPVYVARGADGVISILSLAADGTLTDTKHPIEAGANVVAGLATDSTGQRLYAADNFGKAQSEMQSVLRLLTINGSQPATNVVVPGYPYAVTAVTKGANADHKVYVGSEQRGVSVVDPTAGKVTKDITTGDHPLSLLLNAAQDRLFVANAGSDTVSIVRTDTDSVEKTILLRPSDARGLAGATPTGLALSPDEKTLYVSLADMNAVAVVDLTKSVVAGYIPVGWYPTSVVVSPDGKRLFVTNARGVVVRTPNDKPVPVAVDAGEARSKYIQNILEGTVSNIDLDAAQKNLPALTQQTLTNNRIVPNLAQQAKTALQNPGIKHVIYIIKENRTYDQVLGDLPQGNGDKSLVMFGRDVTPNLHALAERFVLLDNFYCSAEVSGDGWNWSTGAMANPYVSRNVPYGYTGHTHPYDYEGTNNGVAVDLLGIPDVAHPAGGYIWDAALKGKATLRNYGFFCDDLKLPRKTAENGTEGLNNAADKKALANVTDRDFRQFDLDYADSEAWVKLGLPAFPRQLAKFGKADAPSRYTEWKREFDGYVKSGNMPQMTLLRMGNDHTSGTAPGIWTPTAMVADNDYAVGQVVDAVSHSPFWQSTAIFVIEDDAQAGNDHVDAHRSIAFVISPYITKATHDSRFYNTDSMLHTIENLLGLNPLCQYDAVAPTINVFNGTPSNAEPYTAILPDKSIVGQRNQRTAYRAKDSLRLFPTTVADSGPDDEMTDVVWHAVKGKNVPVPPRHFSFAGHKTKPDHDGDDN